MTISLQALRDKRDQLVASLARVDDLRPGFLTARFRKCGKPNCHCAQKDSPGHGPSFSLTHRVAGKTVTQVVPQGLAVERAKAQIAEYQRHCTKPCDVLALPRTLYLGMDGTGIPLHAEELVGRTGKQPDGSAKTGEVKLCTIWGAESLDEQGTPIRD